MSTPVPTPGATGSVQQQYQSTSDAIAAQAGAAVGGKALGSITDYGLVYGPQAASQRIRQAQINNLPVPTFGTVSVTDLKNEYYKWDDNYRNQFRNKLALLDKNWASATDDQLNKQWQSLVDQSSAYLQQGQNLTPWDILARDISAVSGVGAKPTTTKSTNVSTNYTSALDAEALFTSAAQSLLGRKPTSQEVASFQDLLKQQEAANPQTTTTTTTVGANQTIENQSTTTSGGLSADARALLAQRSVESASDYGEHQAATTLMDWLTSATAGG